MKGIHVTTGKLKNVRGRITGHYAEIGDVRATGKTPAEAMMNFDNRITAMCKSRHPKVVRIWQGYTLIVAPCFDAVGNHSYLVYPDGHVGQTMTAMDAAEEEKSARLHVVQILYGEQKHDGDCPVDCRAGLADCFKVLEGTGKHGEFESWVKFQETYREAKRRGFSDVEAHAIAGNHPNGPRMEERPACQTS